jgi:hypothetical protein
MTSRPPNGFEHGRNEPAEVEGAKKAEEERRAAEAQAFKAKLAKRLPPGEVDRVEIDKARKRTKARPPSIAMSIEDCGTGGCVLYPDHSDEEGHRYRLADTFGTRSLQFVYSMLNGLGKATADHSQNFGFSPGSSDQLAFNAALAVISGVRPKDEIEAMLAAHMAVTNIALLELVARMRGAIAGHIYQGNGMKRLDLLGNLTSKFMRTYTLQIEALTTKRRKGEQNVTVKHVHVHAGGQAVVGNVSHRGGRGVTKNGQQAYGRGRQNPTTTRPISESPAVRCADQEREAVAAALPALGMGNTVTASEPRLRYQSGRNSARC